MSWILLAASLLLAFSAALWAARNSADDFGGRFFVFASVFALQPGLFAQVLSPLHWLTPWPFLTAQALLCAALFYWIPPTRLETPSVRAIPLGVLAAAGFIAILVAANTCLAALAPIHTWDEKMYHASRAAYWLQHQSIGFWETHNERQTALSFQGELFFFWPLLFTRVEAPGRVLTALGYPLAIAAVWLLARRLKAPAPVAAAGAALYAAAPIGLFLARYLKADHWAVLFACGLAYWLLESLETGEDAHPAASLFWAGVSLAVCVHARLYALALIPAVLIVARRGILPTLAGFLSGAAANGLLFLFLSNWSWYGAPTGPADMRGFYGSQPSEWTTIARRAPLIFLDLPGTARLSQSWVNLTGAAHPLRAETADVRWPALYRPPETWPPSRFAFAGILAAAGLLLGWRRPQRTVWLCGAAMLLGPVFTLRWVTADQIPDRFLLPAIALLLVAVLPLLRPWAAWPVLALAVLGAWFPARETAMFVRMWWLMPPAMSIDNSPFDEACRVLPVDARVLLIGNQITQDYPLFGTKSGYRRHIYSWGRGPWDAARFHQLLAVHRITHVLLEDDQELAFHWLAPVDAKPIAAGLDQEPSLQRIPLKTGHQRLYQWSLHTAAAP
ncbi:glycosyltransferase family 39 protein [uncultured Paludibaculum sp.]|uniref:glycosyltransferase family 39 protein n=1 Tax=uncultured Paludibaculum sp. TaxID=1765020 RepID=UPI002AAACF8E|nr:glycosyltransferase family 39 protein [uncultured Paludibaculum sp.]